jgi:D-alanyl-D-alanine carboxypeptidase/D-alanyl-D-alanine-endopeptidase (penicillin-binding protein 4)
VPAPSPDTAAVWLQAWLDAHAGTTPPARVVNGSGLARETRLSPGQLAALLRWGWAQPWMPELLSSLPVAGQDGTLSRQPGRFGAAAGRAHLKTGSLRDVVAIAGIVDAPSGRRWVVVAVINHPQAAAARPALDALLRWVAQDAPEAKSVP